MSITCKLMDEEVLAVAAPGSAHAAAAADRHPHHPLLQLESRTGDWGRWLAHHGQPGQRPPAMLFDQFATMTQGAIHGLGVALIPLFLIERDLAEGRLIPVFGAADQVAGQLLPRLAQGHRPTARRCRPSATGSIANQPNLPDFICPINILGVSAQREGAKPPCQFDQTHAPRMAKTRRPHATQPHRRRFLLVCRYRPARSPPPRLDADTTADVAIIGAGFTGLWTAYYLKKANPALNVLVIEKEFAGFGASGRNGGWCMGTFAWNHERLCPRHQRAPRCWTW